MKITLPGMRLRSLNELLRQYPKTRRRQSRKEKNDVGLMLLARVGLARPKPPLVVSLTRVGPVQLDADNAVASFKWVRDEVSRYLKIDDASPLIEWRYAQRVGEYAVEIDIQSQDKGE